MPKPNLFFIILAAALLCSCSVPRVVSNVFKIHPDPLTADSVLVFCPGEDIPNSADVLGTVAVEDKSGTSTPHNYNEALQMAREETARIGGNGLAITNHKEPGTWSSSRYKIEGIMLYLKDMNVDSHQPNPVMEAIETNIQRTEVSYQKSPVPQNTLSANFGYGIVRDIIHVTPHNTYTNQGGFDWRLEYERVFDSGLGYSLQYSGYTTRFPDDTNVNLSYLGISFIGKFKFTEKWIGKLGLGIGVSYYSDGGYNDTEGGGLNFDMGLEYMVSPNTGIGASINAITLSLPVDEDVDVCGRYGINRINFMIGVRYYF